MTIELGLLLGAYDGSQSFENVGSWQVTTSQSSLSIVGDLTHAHSSAFYGSFQSNSSAGNTLKYNYASVNSFWLNFPTTHVDTHRVVSYFWGGVADAVDSGSLRTYLAGATAVIPRTPARVRTEAFVSSGDAVDLEFTSSWDNTTDTVLKIDDVLTAIDVLDLQIDWQNRQNETWQRANHSSFSGKKTEYSWSFSKSWQLPIDYIPSSEAALINLWWREKRPLLFTFNSSDTEDIYIVRIANFSEPFAELERGYWDTQNGNLNLEAIRSNLVF